MKRRLPMPHPPRRRGAFLIVAMISLVLATALLGVMMSMVQAQRRQMAREQQALQADWLAESGVDRAAARLSRDSDYPGETWKVETSAPGDATAEITITITIQSLTDRPDARTVSVEAILNSGPGVTVRRARETTIVLSQES
jgi:Tfp pilus assembly protein PilX